MKKSSLEYVKSNPALFLRNGVFDPGDVCGRYAIQAFQLGAASVCVYKEEDLWVIVCDYNWLLDKDVLEYPESAFTKIITHNRLDANSCFGEIVIAAFSSAVAVYSKGDLVFSMGEDIVIRDKLKRFMTSELMLIICP